METNIRRMRRAADMTQAELAERSGVSRVSIARYERSKTIPTVDCLRRIADALGTTIDNLVRQEG